MPVPPKGTVGSKCKGLDACRDRSMLLCPVYAIGYGRLLSHPVPESQHVSVATHDFDRPLPGLRMVGVLVSSFYYP